MPEFNHGGATIAYDIDGDGYPVLTLAPGGMRSANDLWFNMPWNPRTALADDYSVIGMDQRNAGRSSAPVTASTGWHDYTADQLALLDHLGIERCHVLGMCIGGPFIAGLLKAAPERFDSAVMLQPVGLSDNRHEFEELFDGWSSEISGQHPEAGDADWAAYRQNMWGGSFLLTASTEDLAAIRTPILVLMGNDVYHPEETSREVARSAPNATLIESWKEPEHLAATDAAVRSFLADHTPG